MDPTRRSARGRLARLALALVVLAGTAGGGLASAPTASALDNGLAGTPPMGFNDWNSFGCNIDAQDFRDMADLFVQTGLRAAGYQYINIDDCWMDGRDKARGTTARATVGRSPTAPYRLIPDPTYFPDVDVNGNGSIDPEEQHNGIKALADYIHSKGLKVGIYSSAGTTTCQGLAGSLGYEQVDAQTFADWGIDYLKLDTCGAHSTTTLDGQTVSYPDTVAGYQARYEAMRDALASVDRKIVYSICDFTTNGQSWTWGAGVGNLWRTTTDISASWSSVVSIFKQNVQLAQHAGPGAWNDPDMLEVGNGTALNATENRSHFSLWAMMAAPLIIGSDLRTISDDALSVLLNGDLIALDQDPLGVQAKLVSHDGSSWVLAKPLADGDVAVALFNESGKQATIATTAAAAGLGSRNAYALRDLWNGGTTQTADRIAASVPAHGTVVYRVSPDPGAASEAPSVIVDATPAASVLQPGDSTTVAVTVANDGRSAISSTATSLDAPDGWSATRVGEDVTATLTSGKASTVTYRVTAPATVTDPVATVDLVASAAWKSSGSTGSASTPAAISLVAPLSAPYLSADTTGEGALAGQVGGTLAIDAAGTGVGPAARSTPASDQYGSIYLDGAAGSSAVAQVTVSWREGTVAGDKSGLMMRNDMTGGGSPVGVALYVTAANSVAMAYSTSGGSAYSTTFPTAAGTTVSGSSITLKLVRSASTYTGYWSSDGGATFTILGSGGVTLANQAAATPQDVGVFHTSGAAGGPTETQFTGFTAS
jgi:alpha-galactosidase